MRYLSWAVCLGLASLVLGECGSHRRDRARLVP